MRPAQLPSLLLCTLLSTTLLATPKPAEAQALPALAYTATRTADHVDPYQGTRVADPCRWLEDDNAAETLAWVRAQNAVTHQALAAMPRASW